jgi:hypothetical protein
MLTRQESERLLDACRQLPVPEVNEYRVVCRESSSDRAGLPIEDSRRGAIDAIFQGELCNTDGGGAVSSSRSFQTMSRATLRLPSISGDTLVDACAMLRDLVRNSDEGGIRTAAALRDWDQSSQFERDFTGRIPGLGPAVYSLLLIIQSVATIKPDVHVLRFVASAVGRKLSPVHAISAHSVAALELGLTPSQVIGEFGSISDGSRQQHR